MDAVTRSALARFQDANQLPPTGEPDEATIRKLGLNPKKIFESALGRRAHDSGGRADESGTSRVVARGVRTHEGQPGQEEEHERPEAKRAAPDQIEHVASQIDDDLLSLASAEAREEWASARTQWRGGAARRSWSLTTSRSS